MIALMAVAALSFPQAKQAIRVDAKLDHPQHVWVDRCRRRSPVSVRCRLTEEVVEERPGLVVETALTGKVTVTREHGGILRVHRNG